MQRALRHDDVARTHARVRVGDGERDVVPATLVRLEEQLADNLVTHPDGQRRLEHASRLVPVRQRLVRRFVLSSTFLVVDGAAECGR